MQTLEIKNKLDRIIDIWLTLGIGIGCYGLMSFMCIYLLFVSKLNVYSPNYPLYLLITLTIISVAGMVYSIFRLFILLKNNKDANT
jgi:uncharacterized membrane protein